jgi:hypothetical protein
MYANLDQRGAEDMPRRVEAERQAVVNLDRAIERERTEKRERAAGLLLGVQR